LGFIFNIGSDKETETINFYEEGLVKSTITTERLSWSKWTWGAVGIVGCIIIAIGLWAFLNIELCGKKFEGVIPQ
jgi:hypothetical protein